MTAEELQALPLGTYLVCTAHGFSDILVRRGHWCSCGWYAESVAGIAPPMYVQPEDLSIPAPDSPEAQLAAELWLYANHREWFVACGRPRPHRYLDNAVTIGTSHGLHVEYWASDGSWDLCRGSAVLHGGTQAPSLAQAVVAAKPWEHEGGGSDE